MSDRELRPLRSIRITGDGRCLFRSVAYGACLRRGKQPPSESAQKELADELREKVTEEFVQRRGDTEWFLEGDFESYVSQMRKPHAWGGEPELLMCSHVLKMPITVYMYTKGSDSPRIIAEYGQEYGKDNPVRVLYDGYGHYDALQSPLERNVDSRRMRYLSFFSREAAKYRHLLRLDFAQFDKPYSTYEIQPGFTVPPFALLQG